MKYFVPTSAADIDEMKNRGDSEGANLEFKSAKLFQKKNDQIFADLSKEITAFGNAGGGVLIIGLEDSNRAISEVLPITDPTKDESWIENGLLSRISPPVQFTIEKIEYGSGFLLVLNVPASRNAPHQASDKRFYARRLFRVDPLLQFEIDDLRRRLTAQTDGATLSVKAEAGLFLIEILNTGSSAIFNIEIAISGISNSEIAAEWNPALGRPYSEPFKVMYPGETRRFPASGFDVLRNKLGDKMSVTLFYTDSNGTTHRSTTDYYLEDFAGDWRQPAPLQDQLETIGSALEKIEREINSLNRHIQKFVDRTTHPSGLSLSLSTLEAITDGANIKWPGADLEPDTLAELLDVDSETAFKIYKGLYRASHFMGGTTKTLEELDIPEAVKDKVRSIFR